MKRRHLTCLFPLFMLLSGCGQKGPLFVPERPDKTPATPQAQQTPQTTAVPQR